MCVALSLCVDFLIPFTCVRDRHLKWKFSNWIIVAKRVARRVLGLVLMNYNGDIKKSVWLK